MDGLKFKLDDESSLPPDPLGHPDVPVKLVGAKVSYGGEQKLEDIGFAFGLEARASVEAFNAPSDEDGDKVAGPDNDDELLAPAVVLDGEQAWLKYRVATKAKVSAKADVVPVEAVPLGLKVDGSFGVVFTDFHVHDRETPVRQAVLADLPKLRFAGNPDDIFKLGPHDALSYQVRGELSASVTLSWSDVFTGNLGALSGLLKGGAVLALEIGGSVTVNVGAVDDFRVVFLKGGGDKVRVVIKKADARELGVSPSVGLTVGFADPQAVKQALNAFVKAVAGDEIAIIDVLIGQASLDALPESGRKLVVALFERLGLEAEKQPWNVLQEKWGRVKEEAAKIIKEIAEAKVGVGFKYDYLRTKVEETLLEVELDEARVREFHNDLMLCRTGNLLAWVGRHPEAKALKKYLHQKTLVRSHAWGFTLGIGPWIKIGGLDKKELKAVIRTDRKSDRQQVAYRGVREYSGFDLFEKAKWTSDFKAEMPEFSAGPQATACEFDYGLHLRFEWEQKDLSEEELERYVDHAVIWRALNAGDAAAVKRRVGGWLGEKAQVSVELKFDDETLRRLLPPAAALADDKQAGAAAGARALARAMPYWSVFEARKNPRLREVCYTPLWQYYFENDDQFAGYYASVAADTIRKFTDIYGYQELAQREKGLSSLLPAYQDINTFAGQIYSNGLDSDGDYSVIHDTWLSFLGGLKQLNRAVTPGSCAPHGELAKVFKSLSRFWSQSLFVRAAGVFLLDLAATQSGLLKRVGRTMNVSLVEGEKKTVVFCASLGKP